MADIGPTICRGIGVTGLSDLELVRLNTYWRAANYLTVGQIFLLDNALVLEALRPEHTKPRLMGHWGTSPGLNFIYAHLTRVITRRDTEAVFVCGPGHGGPAVVANAWLEGTYSERPPPSRGMWLAWPGYSASSPFPAASPVMRHPRPRARFTKEGSSAIPFRTPSERPSTTPTSSWPASSATARRRPERPRQAGTRTSS